MSRKNRIAFCLICAALCSLCCASIAADAEEKHSGALPATPELEKWFSFAREVERGLRDGDSHFALDLKRSGEGSSAYALVKFNGKVVGAFLPENFATNVVGEIASFNIARALGCGELFQPAASMKLRGKGLAAFQHLLETADFTGMRDANRWNILNQIDADPEDLHGVFKQWLSINPVEYHSIEMPNGPPDGALNEADPIARFLRASAPQPPETEITPPGVDGRAPARELARQLSDILLVDALAGQWDRFSGGNLHMYVENGVARFAALDNGGTSFKDEPGYVEQFKKSVSRFDRPVVENLFALDAFLDKPNEKPFRGFRSEKELADALGLDDGGEWKVFASRVRAVAAYIRSASSRDGAFFETAPVHARR